MSPAPRSGDLRFDGRTVIVSGAGRGLGRAHARLLGERGANVVVNDVGRDEQGRPTAGVVADEITDAGGTAVADTTDIADPEGAAAIVDAAVERFGSIDAVVNNAGIAGYAPFTEYPREMYDRVLAVHLGGTWGLTQAAWPHFLHQGSGRVVITISSAGLFGSPQGTAYAAAKGALYGLMRSLAVAGEAHGVKVNAVNPGAWTPLWASVSTLSPGERKHYAKEWPPELVAPVVAVLAHETCPCTGEIVSAIGPKVSRVFVAETRGIEVAPGFTPEQLLDRLDEVFDEDPYTLPTVRLPR